MVVDYNHGVDMKIYISKVKNFSFLYYVQPLTAATPLIFKGTKNMKSYIWRNSINQT